MHRYDYSFLKKSVPGNIVGLTATYLLQLITNPAYEPFSFLPCKIGRL